ncbi:hypothetical protein OJF2_51230 [Aquisphaera giovannonii]|uniref:Uncharacterized protein n=1 Tax=Aquisphaera giovannonii TaxID=406548 RepID=A0A5B9W8Q7_9BACT|nr:hypothetical protein [Aquisphaera giovannonii]QEH36539.1 hypothetical protein OJF2_51230 [Aquisphaera giovannonii]
MSNYPDNFNGTPLDLTPAQERATERLDQIHAVYRDVLSAFVGSCIKNRVMVSRIDIEVAMEGVGEALVNEADNALTVLPAASYTPPDAKKLIERAHDAIVDALRLKPIDYMSVFKDIFRPVPTNPATRGFGGDGQ